MATIGNQMKNIKTLSVLILIALVLSGCLSNANFAEQQQVEQQQNQYINAQPVPQFTWSLERHEMIEIYKARNNAISTYSVIYNQYKGIIEFECPSFGYPIPGGTELTNPEAVDRNYTSNVLPQPEPNGLFSPGTSAGTYVMCRNDDGTAYPVYIEDNVLTFPYPVKTDENGKLVKANESDKSSININVNKPAP